MGAHRWARRSRVSQAERDPDCFPLRGAEPNMTARAMFHRPVTDINDEPQVETMRTTRGQRRAIRQSQRRRLDAYGPAERFETQDVPRECHAYRHLAEGGRGSTRIRYAARKPPPYRRGDYVS